MRRATTGRTTLPALNAVSPTSPPTSQTPGAASATRTTIGGRSAASLVVVMVALVALLFTAMSASVAGATAEPETEEEPAVDPAQEALDNQLREGAAVYTQVCASCHQAGGAGIEGQFPPLRDNPNVDDADYVADVIVNGRQGEIVVAGVTYDGVMPSFSTLGDDEIEAVIVYIQNDFTAPAAAIAAFEESGPVAGTELPELANLTTALAFLVAIGAIGLVLAPRLTSANSRLATPWLDAWLKTAVIVAGVVFLTVVVPDWALKTSAVGELSRFGQDVVGSGLWALGLGIMLGGLWYAHRENRI